MSKHYAELNTESTFDLFNKRTVYKARALTSVIDTYNIVDFNLAERSLFGKVDYYFSPIFMEYNSNLKPLRGSPQEGNFYAVNFVADLFNEMSMEFDRCVATGQLDANDPFLSSLQVFKAYEAPQLNYKNYRKIFFNVMKDQFLAKHILVEIFSHYLSEFMKIAPLALGKTPFTFPGYVKSRNNSMLTSGLAIEIADLQYQNDEEKKNQFLESRNWNFFVNACNKYGFMIDYNIPWRIVCDFRAKEVHPYILPYYNNSMSFLEMGYSRASLRYFATLPAELLRLYNAVKRKLIVKRKECDGKEINVQIRPPNYTAGEIVSEYGYDYFLKMYMKLRQIEEKPDLDKEQKRRLMKDVVIYSKLKGTYVPIETKFERFINKPFDKPHSFSYIFNIQQPAVTKATFEKAEIGAYALSDLTKNTTGY